MTAATAVPAARIVTTPRQKRLIAARCAAAPPARTARWLVGEGRARPEGPRVCVSIVISKILRQTFDRAGQFADGGGQSPPWKPRPEGRKPHDQGIAPIFHVEFEPLGQV